MHSTRTSQKWIHSTRTHLVLYSWLLVATPFILLQNFLVETIAAASGYSIEIGTLEIPAVPIAALMALMIVGVIYRRHLTRIRIAAGVIVLLMITLSQQITDFYFDHNFYDLQQNWHYFAYSIFAFMMYRDLAPRNTPTARIMLYTFLAALVFSTFDETFQMFMSNRVFDVSDIGKDVWGALMGIVFVLLVGKRSSALIKGWRKIRNRKLAGYFNHPPSLLIVMIAFNLIFLSVGSLLTDFQYWKYVAVLTIGLFAFFFAVLHLSQFRLASYAIAITLVLAVTAQAYSFVKYREENIVYNRYALTVYKGIPIPFFDLMIYPDGAFRLVDKKHLFNRRDRSFFFKRKSDIIIIASGAFGLGGKGFPPKEVQFLYNPYLHRGSQVIITKTEEACRLFNRLKAERKNVLFVLHNTC